MVARLFMFIFISSFSRPLSHKEFPTMDCYWYLLNKIMCKINTIAREKLNFSTTGERFYEKIYYLCT